MSTTSQRASSPIPEMLQPDTTIEFYEEQLCFSVNVPPTTCKAWATHRDAIATCIIDLAPRMNFFIGIAHYHNLIQPGKGDCIFAIIEDYNFQERVKTAIQNVAKGTLLEETRVIVDHGSVLLDYTSGVDTMDPALKGEYSISYSPGASIGAAGSNNSGSLGVWIPNTDYVLTTCSAVTQNGAMRVAAVRLPSDQDTAIHRRKIVQDRANAHHGFLWCHQQLVEEPDSFRAEYTVRKVLDCERALKSYDSLNKEELQRLGSIVAGWKGVVERISDCQPAKCCWVDIAVLRGNPRRRENTNFRGKDLDNSCWAAPRHGQEVAKTGRTTGTTLGHVGPAEGILRVGDSVTTEWYIVPGNLRLKNPPYLNMTFALEGDSGAAILAADGSEVVGILFGAAEVQGADSVMVDITLFMPADRVARAVNEMLEEEVIHEIGELGDFVLKPTPRTERIMLKSSEVLEGVVHAAAREEVGEIVGPESGDTESEDIDWDLYPELKHLTYRKV